MINFIFDDFLDKLQECDLRLNLTILMTLIYITPRFLKKSNISDWYQGPRGFVAGLKTELTVSTSSRQMDAAPDGIYLELGGKNFVNNSITKPFSLIVIC